MSVGGAVDGNGAGGVAGHEAGHNMVGLIGGDGIVGAAAVVFADSEVIGLGKSGFNFVRCEVVDNIFDVCLAVFVNETVCREDSHKFRVEVIVAEFAVADVEITERFNGADFVVEDCRNVSVIVYMDGGFVLAGSLQDGAVIVHKDDGVLVGDKADTVETLDGGDTVSVAAGDGVVILAAQFDGGVVSGFDDICDFVKAVLVLNEFVLAGEDNAVFGFGSDQLIFVTALGVTVDLPCFCVGVLHVDVLFLAVNECGQNIAEAAVFIDTVCIVESNEIFAGIGERYAFRDGYDCAVMDDRGDSGAEFELFADGFGGDAGSLVAEIVGIVTDTDAGSGDALYGAIHGVEDFRDVEFSGLFVVVVEDIIVFFRVSFVDKVEVFFLFAVREVDLAVLVDFKSVHFEHTDETALCGFFTVVGEEGDAVETEKFGKFVDIFDHVEFAVVVVCVQDEFVVVGGEFVGVFINESVLGAADFHSITVGVDLRGVEGLRFGHRNCGENGVLAVCRVVNHAVCVSEVVVFLTGEVHLFERNRHIEGIVVFIEAEQGHVIVLDGGIAVDGVVVGGDENSSGHTVVEDFFDNGRGFVVDVAICGGLADEVFRGESVVQDDCRFGTGEGFFVVNIFETAVKTELDRRVDIRPRVVVIHLVAVLTERANEHGHGILLGDAFSGFEGGLRCTAQVTCCVCPGDRAVVVGFIEVGEAGGVHASGVVTAEHESEQERCHLFAGDELVRRKFSGGCALDDTDVR